MRSKSKQLFEVVMILLPLITVMVFSLSILSYEWISNSTMVNVVAFSALITAALSGLVPAVIRRNVDHEVARNLYAELEGIRKRICCGDKCECGVNIPLHHSFFDSLVKSGMISHVNPNYLYKVQHLYWLIRTYNEKYIEQQNESERRIEKKKYESDIKCLIIKLCNEIKKDTKG